MYACAAWPLELSLVKRSFQKSTEEKRVAFVTQPKLYVLYKFRPRTKCSYEMGGICKSRAAPEAQAVNH
jgi:hypothetical protein